MSPNPVTAAATWTVALTVDGIAVVVAVVLLAWDHGCPSGFAGCPTPAEVAHRDELVLVGLGLVVLAVAVYALLRGRLQLLVVQLALLVVLGLAASAWLPDGFAALRHDAHLAGGPGTAQGQGALRDRIA